MNIGQFSTARYKKMMRRCFSMGILVGQSAAKRQLRRNANSSGEETLRQVGLVALVLVGFVGCTSTDATRLPEAATGHEGSWAYDYGAHGPYYVQLHGVRRYVASINGIETLTNKRMLPRVVEEADAASITPNTDNGDISYQSNTQATGTLTINADTGAPTDGEQWTFKIKSTNVQTYSWDPMYVGGATVKLPAASSRGGKIDYVTFIYDAENSKWNCIRVVAGY
jgi:hypothetical protein